ncbi:MAG: prepilin-type N-terminal cleavage/methylation domain-containing protein, partial [Verrucomicrobiales bacterium]|nr:prepilin-type N-terminal cleavage/methylation domain-containing protein [Verrucomicrobiales bacterium]
MKARPNRKQAGLTLTEMLVVIVLLGLLAGIGIPSFAHIRNKGYAAQCTSKLRQIGVSLNLYIGDNGLVFPVLAPGRESRDDTETPVLETILRDYVNSDTIFQCPSD